MSEPIKDYIGDGVYVIYDGYSIWLHANHPDFPTDKVCLEPDVMKRLNEFAERVGMRK
jgi:hypothetical protein